MNLLAIAFGAKVITEASLVECRIGPIWQDFVVVVHARDLRHMSAVDGRRQRLAERIGQHC